MEVTSLIFDAIADGFRISLPYFLAPQILLIHTVGYSLVLHLIFGINRPCPILYILLAEFSTWFLWCYVETDFTTFICVTIWVTVYERLAGPRADIRNNAILFADPDEYDALEKAKDDLKFHSWSASQYEKSVIVATGLKYSARWPSFCLRLFISKDVSLGEISAIEKGRDPMLIPGLNTHNVQDEVCFHICIKNSVYVTYIAESSKERDQWLSLLSTVVESYILRRKEKWIHHLLGELDINIEEGLNVTQAADLLSKASRYIDTTYIKELISSYSKKANRNKSHADVYLSKENLPSFLENTLTRPEIKMVFAQLNHGFNNKAMTPQQLQNFMLNEQKEEICLETCREWLAEHEPVLSKKRLSHIGFASLLMSDKMKAWSSEHAGVYQEMNHPLSHYFIASSHNTYCSKDQLKGKSSVDMYIQAFKRGCKCVELDCWDGTNNEPVIYHGHTLTSKILFRDVIQAINDYAFCVSDFPVILSFENHCSVDQQKVMANYMINILGNKLYTGDIPENISALPSPLELSGYVLVKGKKLAAGEKEGEVFESDSDDSDFEDEVEIMAGPENYGKEWVKNDRKGSTMSDDTDKISMTSDETVPSSESDNTRWSSSPEKDGIGSDSLGVEATDQENKPGENGHDDILDEDEMISQSNEKSRKRYATLSKFMPGAVRRSPAFSKSIKSSHKGRKIKLAKEFSDLVNYCQAVHFKGFNSYKGKQKCFEMSSFGEGRATKFIKENRAQVLEYTKRHLARIYPAGHRVDSSNYDPMPMWSAGCQLVALNYQTPGKAMILNQGFFRDNGGCGYVLKPQFMRTLDPKIEPKALTDNYTNLCIKIISGNQLPYSKEEKVKSERGFSVHFRCHGIDIDQHKEKTKTVKSNGFHPIWNETFNLKLHMPELAVLNFSVKEADSLVALCTIPFKCMKYGYRWIPLLLKNEEPSPYSYLFLHIKVTGNNQI